MIVTSNYHASFGDQIQADCSSGPITIFLPSPVNAAATISVQKIDATSNAVTILCQSAPFSTTFSSQNQTQAFTSTAVGWTAGYPDPALLGPLTTSAQTYLQALVAATYARTILNKSTSYTLGADDTVVFTCASAGIIATLPAASGISTRHYAIINSGASTNPLNIQSLGGSIPQARLMPGNGLEIVSDGTNWQPVTNPNNTLANYNISASLASYTAATVAANATLTVGAHDFSVGQGVRVWGAGGTGGGAPPSTPTITAVGANSATVTYQYQVAASLSGNSAMDAMSSASTATTFSGNSSLSTTNYNKVAFTPASNIQMYTIYGRVAGTMQPLGHLWNLGPPGFSASLNAGNTPPIGANLAPSTQYTYGLTGVDFMGNETPILPFGAGGNAGTVSVTTGGTVTGINVFWSYGSGPSGNFKFYNVYRATGVGAMQFMAQVNPFDLVFQDSGNIVPGASPPTQLTFSDTGQLACNGTGSWAGGGPGRPVHIPVSPPAAQTNNSLFTSVIAVTPTTITLAAAPSVSLASTTVVHDDSVAIKNAFANKSVTLPDGYYPIGQQISSAVSSCLSGQNATAPWCQNVSQNANPSPKAAAVTLVLTSFVSPLVFQGMGASVRKVTLFYPYQTNGVLATAANASPPVVQSIIPYGPAIVGNGLQQEFTDIIDCNSFIGLYWVGSTGRALRWWPGAIRFPILCQSSETVIRDLKGNHANFYSNNVNTPGLPDQTAVRGFASGLATISDIAVDGSTAVWWTLSTGGTSGTGNIGNNIENVWTDDTSNLTGGSLRIDTPAFDIYASAGGVFSAQLSNIFLISGSVAASIVNPYGSMVGGANDCHVTLTNVCGAWNLTGNFHAHFSGSSLGQITFAATSNLGFQNPAHIRATFSSCGMGGLPRFLVSSGNVKCYMSGCTNTIINHHINDTVTGGSLYVIDEQLIATEKFVIPTGTVLATGDNTVEIGLIAPQQNVVNSLYVIRAKGNGTSVTDVWKLNGSALFTTSATVGSLKVGAAGEGVGNVPASLHETALLTIANTAGTSHTVYPVVLNVAAGLTTAAPMECWITYCISPTSA